jgi:DNA-binding NtrC family response regulator
VRDRLEQLVSEMVERGIRYEDAQREFQRQFIACVVAKCAGNLSKAAALLGVHRNTLTRKLHELKMGKTALTREPRGHREKRAAQP